jgi:hypothetical protein
LTETGLKAALESVVIDFGVSAAEAVMKAAAISGEGALAAERGDSPKSATTGSRILDATIGGGDLEFREASEPRIVLVTDQHIYVFEGRSRGNSSAASTSPRQDSRARAQTSRFPTAA